MDAEVEIAKRVAPFCGIVEAMGRRVQFFLVGTDGFEKTASVS